MAIGLHAPPSNAWGIVWRYCGNVNCARPKDIRSNAVGSGSHAKIRQYCCRCGWESATVHVNQLSWINRWSNSHPLVFTWEHPIEPINLLSFVTTKPKKTGKGKAGDNSEMKMEVD